MRELLLVDGVDHSYFEIGGRDHGDILEIKPISACPDRGTLAVYIVELDEEKLKFPVEPNSELDAWLWTSMNHKTWIWIDTDGKINWESSRDAKRLG
jgi:hypothetical protein